MIYHHNMSVLRTLRGLVPHRSLTHFESLQIAELQANRLLELFQVIGPMVPSELISELPRFEVRVEPDLPVSGSTHWENSRWVITLNAAEPWTRQRYSLMHEFKHALDHEAKVRLYGNVDVDVAAQQRAERAADHFAACTLMPKRWLKREWLSSQHLPTVAKRLGVSPRALSVRLWHLGLAVETPRCPTTSLPNDRPGKIRRYLRARSTTEVAA